jgi:hypothetical protein
MSTDADLRAAKKVRDQSIRGRFTIGNVLETVRLAHQIYRSEPISIKMFGDDRIRSIHRDFTSGHRLLPWVVKKGFGVALIDLRDDQSVDFTGTGRRSQQCRKKLRKSLKESYSFRAIDPPHHVDEILAINRSAHLRQGRPLERVYLDPDHVRRVASEERIAFGVFDHESTLRAYTYTPILGDVFTFSYIIGDYAHLKNGIMYLLVQQTLVSMRARYQRDGFPRWASYDTVLGALPGLRQFKFELGFKPCRVRWEWIDHEGVRE